MKKLITLLALIMASPFWGDGRGVAQIITTVAGDGAQGYSGDGGQATAAELNGAFDIAFDAHGNLYIIDQNNNAIRKVSTAGIISTIAGTGLAGYTGDGGQATAAELKGPKGIVFDANGNLYFGDAGSSHIRKINTAGIISTIAGTGTYGYSGDGGQATAAQIWNPFSFTFDAVGNLFFSDEINWCVRKINTSGIITTIAGNGSGGFSGDGGQATLARLNHTSGIAFDAAGNLYIADDGSRIRMVNTAGIINTVVGNGGSSYSGDGGAATAAQIGFGPFGLTFDASGNLYIADGNSRIRMVNTSGIISTIAGTGINGFSGDGGLATAAELSAPTAVTFDATGNLYIADESNKRIRMITNVANAGIEQFTSNKEQINIYPNPNNGSFVIEPNNATKQTMQVYDVTGKLVLSQTLTGKTSIDASSLAEGVYNISLLSAEGILNKKLVIVR